MFWRLFGQLGICVYVYIIIYERGKHNTAVEVNREGATAPYLILFFPFLRATFRLDLDYIKELFNCNCL